MTKIRIGLMGFGRIGRNVFRLMRDHPDLEVGVICDVADPAALTYLLKYDSIYGRYPGEVDYSDGLLRADGRDIVFLSEKTPADVKWGEHGVDLVVELRQPLMDLAGYRICYGELSGQYNTELVVTDAAATEYQLALPTGSRLTAST